MISVFVSLSTVVVLLSGQMGLVTLCFGVFVSACG